MSDQNELDQLCINTIRTLSMDAVEKANSGHPGTPMALAPLAHVIYDRLLSFNPANPGWLNRDRFVLSAGHASMLLYSALHLNGYELSVDDLKQFRQLHSRCPGHPEFFPEILTPGVECTTGPLGQGAAMSVGMAVAERWLAARYNRPGHDIINHHVYAVPGDGCLMEGVSAEAASLAGHLGLGNLTWIYDSNRITIEGGTDLAFSENVGQRFAAYGWHVQDVQDVNDLEAVQAALAAAAAVTDKPSLVIVHSHIGFGAPKKQDTAAAHGEALGAEEIAGAKRAYGWDPEAHFLVPDAVQARIPAVRERGAAREAAWRQALVAYRAEYPELATELELIENRGLPEGWDADLPVFPADAKGLATRESGGKVLNALAPRIPWLVGGSADLAPSTKTLMKDAGSFQAATPEGRNMHFGIREHAMAAAVNGMTLSGLRSYGATFAVFSDYLRPALRLSALMEQPAIQVFTHDSIGLGEDGPTHQPIEHLASLRAMPHLTVIRPGDANETSEAWRAALDLASTGLKTGPVALVLSRQAMPTLDRERYAPVSGARRGGYVLADSEGEPQVILIGTGSELQLCVAAHERLVSEGVRSRVVSLPSWEIFDAQDKAYRDEVLPPSVTARISVEMGSTFGWERYIGCGGRAIGIDRFGASAPIKDLLPEFGFTVDNVVSTAKELMGAGIAR